jgi:hypothetical protein
LANWGYFERFPGRHLFEEMLKTAEFAGNTSYNVQDLPIPALV